MDELLRFLETYEIWFYTLLGIVGFFYLQRLVQAWGELRLAIFGLERETALRHLATSITMMIILILIGSSIFLLVSFIAPSYPKNSILSTPTFNPLATTTKIIPFTTPQIISTTLGTTAPSSVESSGCITGQIEWTFPKAGEEISGIVELKGIVNIPNLGFYKYEVSQLGSNVWKTIAAGNQNKNDETLGGAWDTSQELPGDYLLRLTITDNQNNYLPTCEIPIRIIASQ